MKLCIYFVWAMTRDVDGQCSLFLGGSLMKQVQFGGCIGYKSGCFVFHEFESYRCLGECLRRRLWFK